MGFWKQWEIGMIEDGVSRREILEAARAMNPQPRNVESAPVDADDPHLTIT